ncbi:MAG: ABC transporter permease, partial [Bacteroidota bacterium]
INAENAYRSAAEKMNLNLPAFYFTITSKAYPDTLHKVPIRFRRQTLEKLTAQFGNWQEIQTYYNSIRSLDLRFLAQPDSIRRPATQFKQALRELYIASKDAAISAKLATMSANLEKDTALNSCLASDFSSLKNNWQTVKNQATPGKLLLPAFHWNGLKNQYHRWLFNFLGGDFGVSVYDRRPVEDKVKPALFWTLVVNLGAIFLAYLLAIPLGVWSAVRRGQWFDRVTSLGLFMLYSLPAFWIATMLVIFFSTREYGMDWFDIGLGNVPSNAPWWKKIGLAAPNLLLPILCVAYPSWAYISRQVRGAMNSALAQDYVRTARAKGLPERQVVWKHAFRNSLFPLITLFASVFPAAIAGSVAIEYIFNIPGMGWLTLNAILQKDWAVVFSVLMLGSMLTMVGMLVADLLYAAADPRVKFK